jgi:hypothetical protein
MSVRIVSPVLLLDKPMVEEATVEADSVVAVAMAMMVDMDSEADLEDVVDLVDVAGLEDAVDLEVDLVVVGMAVEEDTVVTVEDLEDINPIKLMSQLLRMTSLTQLLPAVILR